MVTYNYTRNRLASGDNINEWDIDNPNRVDGGEEPIHLADEIKTAVIAKNLSSPGMVCDGANCYIYFDEALSAGEEATLTTTVNNHENNV